MINSEREPMQLQIQVSQIETMDFDAFLIMSHDGENELGLRNDLDPEEAVIIQMDAAQIVKEEASRLTINELRGRIWKNGKWWEFDLNLVGDFDQDSLHCEAVIVVTDHHP